MHGPEGTAELARTWIAGQLPARLAALEQRLALPAHALPLPALVVAYDKARLAVEDWPAVVVEVEELRSLALVDTDDAGDVYRCRYAARFVLWVRGDSYADVDLTRKRYTLALRELVLSSQHLRPHRLPGSPDTGALTADTSTLRESLSPELADEQGRSIAGAFLELDLLTLELLEAPAPLGVALDYAADTHALPAHPAL